MPCVRKNIIDQSNKNVKEYSLGPLESENIWKEWESTLINYFSTLIGVNLFPLSYTVRENNNPDANGDIPNFIQKNHVCH